METMKQETAPVLSIVMEKKDVAAQFIAGKIETLVSEKGLSVLDAAREAYEEVKGEKYREEQAAGLLLHALEKRNEADMVEKEVTQIYPHFANIIGDRKTTSSNDERYLVAA